MTQMTQGGLDIQIVNSQNVNTVDNKAANTVRLQLTNQTGGVLNLAGGAPDDPSTSSVFVVQVFFGPLFANPGDTAHLEPAPISGWTVRYVDDPKFPCWGLAPDQSYAWGVGETISISFGNLTPTAAAGLVCVAVDVFNLPGQSFFSQECQVGIVSASAGPSLATAVRMSLSPGSINIDRTLEPSSCPPNVITLELQNLTDKPLFQGTNWPSTPMFHLGFVYASAPPGSFALTTVDQAVNITVGLGEGTTGWIVNSIDGPIWEIVPSSDNKKILGAGDGDGGIATFTISGIQTNFSNTPTPVYLLYNNVPGYSDGMLVEVLDKQYASLQLTMTADQSSLPVSADGTAQASLNWSVQNATLVTLSGVGKVQFQETDHPVQIEETTSFVLTAYDTYLNQILTKQATVSLLDEGISQQPSALLSGTLPSGIFLPWSGSADDLPAGYAACDGRQLTSGDNPALVQALGENFGGDGVTCSNLPDLRTRVVQGAGDGLQVGQTGVMPVTVWTPISDQAPIQVMSNTSPGAVAFLDKLCLFYTGSGSFNIYMMTSQDGRTWGNSPQLVNAVQLGILKGTSPNPVFFEKRNQLYVFYNGCGCDGAWYTTTTDGALWTTVQSVRAQVPTMNLMDGTSPNVVVFQDTLYLFFTGSGDNGIFYVTSTDGINWNNGNPVTQILQGSSNNFLNVMRYTSASAAVLGETLYLFFTDAGGQGIFCTTSNNGKQWSSAVQAAPATSVYQGTSPSALALGGLLYLSWVSGSGDSLSLAVSPDGVRWSPPQPQPVQMTASQGVLKGTSPWMAEFGSLPFLFWTSQSGSSAGVSSTLALNFFLGEYLKPDSLGAIISNALTQE